MPVTWLLYKIIFFRLSFQLMDVKCSNYGGAGFTPVGNTTFIYPPNHENHILKCSKSKDQFNQAYEEVSASSDGKRGTADSDVDSEVEDDGDGEDMSSMSSEGELAEDELSLVEYPKKSYRENGESRPCSDASSLRGSTGDDLCRDFESTCSDDNDPRSCHHPSEFQRSIDRVYPFDGPVATSTEQRKKRKVKARNPKGVDHVRPHLHQAQPLPAIIDAYPYPINSDMMQGHLGLNVVGSDPYDDPCLSDRPPSDVLPVTRVPRGPSWRTPEMPLPLGDYHSDDRSMVLKVPNVHPQQRLPNSGGGMVELNVPKLGHHPRNNVLYRNNGDARDNHRVPPDEYGLLPGNSTWGPETGSSQRNSDPHDRNLAEFSTFRPRKSSQSRDLFGLDAGLLNNDLGGHYGHLPPSQRSSGSDGSKGSSNSAERLLPPNSEPGVGIGGGGGGPYQQHYHPHSHQLPQQPQSHFLGSSPSSTGGGHRVAFPSNQRVKRKQGDKNTAELDAGYGARTVFT